ncbi:hypothetical protein [Stenotrophomonas rhizophila]|nr:hypothetical protein [Stenotrophomonas rhizophila]
MDQQTGTCTQAAFVPRTDIPDLTPAQVTGMLSLVLTAFALAWAYRQLGRTIRS